MQAIHSAFYAVHFSGVAYRNFMKNNVLYLFEFRFIDIDAVIYPSHIP